VANSRTIERNTSPDLLTVAGDIADPETASRIIGAAIDSFGRVDTLVNNAGVFLSKPFVEYTEADFAMVVGVNLAGSFRLSQRAAVAMLREGNGHIVNITTSLVDQPMTAMPSALAALTKGGLDAVTRSLAIEYAGKGSLQQEAGQPDERRAALRGAHPPKPSGVEPNAELARDCGWQRRCRQAFHLAPPGRWSDRPGSFV
jgi:NAD(P)-dependent dehydrogenase (short-subunit alcohol dehydrogenase family)